MQGSSHTRRGWRYWILSIAMYIPVTKMSDLGRSVMNPKVNLGSAVANMVQGHCRVIQRGNSHRAEEILTVIAIGYRRVTANESAR